MPKRTDINSVLIIGAGPIVIGQACEFDYSGVQACKALREEGLRVILVNSNPATIMTDPDVADRVYIELLDLDSLTHIIELERPDAVLPTMGGQTALNCAMALHQAGVLARFGVAMIGASPEAITMAEDRDRFRKAMREIGLAVPHSSVAHTLEQARRQQADFGYPVIIRPSFTLGGSGGGIAWNHEEFAEIVACGLGLSPTTEVLLEESVLGWREFELEVVRDAHDNCIIVCSIENFDPMGVHTGDSITVAPAQTLTDKEYQVLRDASIAVLRKIGVDTGGSNVQFGVSASDGRVVVIEMNPRVSRSSALASKATGFPIARVAAKLAVGFTLEELGNDITGGLTPASFEPCIDYVVTKVPRFAFEKFSATDARLTTQMKSVGEAMALGRSFQDSLQKALRSLEQGYNGLNPVLENVPEEDRMVVIQHELSEPGPDRILYIAEAFRAGLSMAQIHALCYVDPWFLAQLQGIVTAETRLRDAGLKSLDASRMLELKRMGFADARIAELLSVSEAQIRQTRYRLGVRPVYKRVDSCAAEFPVATAYLYSCYETECESEPSKNKKIIVLGSGPNRIGQGIEFDYCCVHAAFALRDAGFETIMVNCNPETVSTDFDTSDRLYFEPLTLEDVLEIVHLEQPDGIIVQYGGQTPLNLATELAEAGAPIIGTSASAIAAAEDREQFSALLRKLGLRQPENRSAHNVHEAMDRAEEIGYPLMVRPSFVLGGRAMEVVYSSNDLSRYLAESALVSPRAPILLDRFLDHAVEIDVDAICDGHDVLVCGIMEHIEQAGVHSGDSTCVLPPHKLSPELCARLSQQVEKMALGIGVLGLMNTQFAVQDDEIYVLEVNPRASRTVPFVSKAIGAPVAKIAARCMVGESLHSQGYNALPKPDYFSVKEPVFPFLKFPGVDPILGPEMRSTGEVMGIARSFDAAFAKAQRAAGIVAPKPGRVIFSVRDADKARAVPIARELLARGFSLVATGGTHDYLASAGVACERINKVLEGRPHIVDLIKSEEIVYIINTTEGRRAIADSFSIRSEALHYRVTYSTTIAGAAAIVSALDHDHGYQAIALQTLHEELEG